MQKKIVVGGILLFGAVVGIIFYATSLRGVPTETPESGSATLLPPGSYTEHAALYDIAANYPTTTPLKADANSAALALIKGFVGSTIDEFKTSGDFARRTPETDAPQNRKESLQITYLIASSPHTVSYIFTVYEDTLGAHGNMFFHTLTFDTTTGAALSLADLFTPNAPYLDTLSQMSRAKLPSIIGDSADPEFIKNGTSSNDKNFESFFFDNKYFVILFAPYQVAPYAAGPQTLRIKAADLANILKPEYRQ
ncbi:MAG: RsiV family protein [Minisyncoccota bacterium]